MNILKKLIIKYQEKVKERNAKCNNYCLEISNILNEIDNLFLDRKKFIEHSVKNEILEKNKDLLEKLEIENLKCLKKATHFNELLNKRKELYYNLNDLKNKIDYHNKIVADIKVEKAYILIGDVEGQILDYQQMSCIVKEAHNHLVIAGAGTGKTTTIIGKIKFLLGSKTCKPEDILVLSFTNSSATEMNERIKKETKCNIEVSTFHKLGLNIISEVEGKAPNITKINLQNFIKEQLQILIKSKDYIRLLNSYLLYNRVPAKSEFDFKSQKEYNEYLELYPPITLNNEKVKSYGELDIANFLNQNGINYIYENPYPIDTRTSEYSQYCPDFFLPDYNIYIEYFGINKNREVPMYFKNTNEISATEKYLNSIEWKRNLHKENNTIMIECYAYEKFDGVLLDNLEKQLHKNSVKFNPKTPKELWKDLSSKNESILEGIVELFGTIINLIKSNGYTIETVRGLNKYNYNQKNNDILLSLVEPIFDQYNNNLKKNDEIDFNDMINLAKEYVIDKIYICPYKYVIIDEYQDISKSRFLLLQSMRYSNDYDLFCVGDDWQSIYRFAGSDINYILNFDDYWGPTEISMIETTYRFSEKMIDISSSFIMQNPSQFRKSMKGKGSTDNHFALGEISAYNEKYAIEFMIQKLNDLPKNSSVFFIGRYSFDVNLLTGNDVLNCKYNNITKLTDVICVNNPTLKMNFLTAHKSKGLQADYVFIINNKKSRLGFPSMIQDAAIFELLLDNMEHFPYAEERRLFYVALTRAKKKTFIVTIEGKESEFAKELKNNFSTELKKEQFECPKCGGQLIKINGKYGFFFGCSNYKTIGCDYKKNITKV